MLASRTGFMASEYQLAEKTAELRCLHPIQLKHLTQLHLLLRDSVSVESKFALHFRNLKIRGFPWSFEAY